MKIATMQFAPAFGDPAGNLEKIRALALFARADLYVLPEFCTTGYQFADRAEATALAEYVPGGRSVARLCEIAAETGAVICAGLAERDGERLYNSAVVVDDGGILLLYRKTHLFKDEKGLFEPGDMGFPVRPLPDRDVRIGALVCFDWIFPEVARALALSGADLLLHPSNLVTPWGQRAMATRALENGVYVALANRIGSEERAGRDRLTFTGGSRILSPRGEVLAELGAEEEGVAVAEIDVAVARNKALTDRNDILGDRRPELYGGLVNRD
jgi:predicted amidohydrolase